MNDSENNAKKRVGDGWTPTPSDTLTLGDSDPLQGHTQNTPTNLNDAIRELRFMCQVYQVVLHQRNRAQENEKRLVERIKNLKSTLQAFGVTDNG